MTQNETSYREKGRAVVLAALMVLSVVAMSAAFAGGAAASHNDDAWEGHTNGDDIDSGAANLSDRVFAGQVIVQNYTSSTDLSEGVDLYQNGSSDNDDIPPRPRPNRLFGC